MKLLKSLFVLLALVGLFTACDDTTDAITPEKPAAPTNLKATSKDTSSIIISWTASTSESDTTFKDYVLEIAPGTFQPVTIAKGTTTYTITGLTEGEVYTFTLHARNSNGDESTTGAVVSWSPASRFTESNGFSIKMYETADNDHGSGIDFYDEASQQPLNVKTSQGSLWNFGLYTTDGTVTVGSPSELGYTFTGGTPVEVEISESYFEATSLNDAFMKDDLSTLKYNVAAIDLTALEATNNVIFIVRFKEGTNTEYTYAKIMLVKSGSNFLQGASPSRYIECEISYQSKPGVPYAF